MTPREMQMKTSEEKNDTMWNKPHKKKKKNEKAARLSEGKWSIIEKNVVQELKSLILTQETYYVSLNRRNIWPNFIQFSPKFTHAPWGGHYFGWKVSTDVIWATYYVGRDLSIDVVSSVSLKSFQISNFYFFSLFYVSYKWQTT